MHTQKNLNRCVFKVAPKGNLQGFQSSYIEDLINLEPCTLWGESLLEVREEYAFSGPQVRACMGHQSSTMSSKGALHPLPTQALKRRQHAILASRWPVLHGSPSTKWPSPKT